MKIGIRTTGLALTRAARSQVRQRLGLALGRFADRIGAITVRLSAANGRRPPDRRCEVDVRLFRPVRVVETDADLLIAVERAGRRASRSVALALDSEVALPPDGWSRRKLRRPP